ncbi:MAG: TatD family hydrolase [Gallionella sp.]|nr:TatD family hydrolase [Gallionella sp.]
MFIDTHCHLDAAEFNGGQSARIAAATAAGVAGIVIPGVARENFALVHTLCAQAPGCFPAFGIHPMYTDQAHPDDLPVLRDYLSKAETVAVGEIGLDFFIDHYDRAQQEYFFIAQLKLAREFDLPVLLHIRRAQDIILKYLRRHPVRGGIAHAFNGSPQQAAEFIKLGFKLGFGGAMTYPRATRLRQLATRLPLDSIVLETDAPDIPPAFLERGSPNAPEYLPQIAATLAELRGMSLQDIARITTENALAALPKLAAAMTAR